VSARGLGDHGKRQGAPTQASIKARRRLILQRNFLVNVQTRLCPCPAFSALRVITLMGSAVPAQTIERVRMTGIPD